MGLGPGGQPIGSSHINQGGGMGNMGPGGKYTNVSYIFTCHLSSLVYFLCMDGI